MADPEKMAKAPKGAWSGLGDESSFLRCHPLLNFVYFAFVIGLTMFANHLIFLLISFCLAWLYSYMLRGSKALGFNLAISVASLLLVTIINILNVHNGETVLFFLNGNRVTLEAVVYGVVMALMLSSMIIWFSCFQVVVTGDKIVYLFGRVAPRLALTISMIMRFIPLLKERFWEIHMGQRCMGRSGQGLMRTLRQLTKEISILTAWSLEASIETADSMEARGYGLHGRSSFHLYRLTRQDAGWLLVLLALGAGALFAAVRGVMTIYYYPKIIMPPVDGRYAAAALVYGALLAVAPVMDIISQLQWKRIYKNDVIGISDGDNNL